MPNAYHHRWIKRVPHFSRPLREVGISPIEPPSSFPKRESMPQPNNPQPPFVFLNVENPAPTPHQARHC